MRSWIFVFLMSVPAIAFTANLRLLDCEVDVPVNGVTINKNTAYLYGLDIDYSISISYFKDDLSNEAKQIVNSRDTKHLFTENDVSVYRLEMEGVDHGNMWIIVSRNYSTTISGSDSEFVYQLLKACLKGKREKTVQ